MLHSLSLFVSCFYFVGSMVFTPPATVSGKPRRERAVPLTVAVVLLILSFALGNYTASRFPVSLGSTTVTGVGLPPPTTVARDLDFSLFWKVWDYVHQNALERPLNDQKLLYSAISGMVAGLDDPYSVFMDPETSKRFAEELEGTFDGIGAEIGIRDDRLVIIAPLPDTPADRAGLRPGDRIVGINDLDTTGMAVDFAVNQIRGPRGTKVKLFVLSTGEQTPREISITRDRIIIQTVKSELKTLPGGKGKVAYLRLVHFSQDADDKFREAWGKLAVGGPKAIILDLRSNPGGYLDQAVAISGHWIKGSLVVTERRGGEVAGHAYMSQGLGELKDFPTVVLVNEGSASASEIVTGALQDYGLATVIGQKTFGKGSVQDLQDFPDGSEVKLTIAKWYTPKDRSINKNGLDPDIVVKLEKADLDAGKDPQLDRALELLAR